MLKVNINLGTRSYPIFIACDYGNIGTYLAKIASKGKTVVVTDTNVDQYQSQELCDVLRASHHEVFKFIIEPGEKSKNLDTVQKMYKFLLDLRLDRQSTLIALGGGVVGDIAGFVAATYLRGINFVQIPTSLLAQADSSVGGKVGVDFEGAKNIIGAFYQPKMVFINVNSLKTLPIRELRSGLAEVIKHGIIKDEQFFGFIEDHVERIFSYNEDTLQYMTKMNCTIKGSIVENDEKEEGGLRALLNFGHTIGHAVESVSGFDLLHGECVSIGMAGAFALAMQLKMVSEQTWERVLNVLTKVGLPVTVKNMDIEKVYRQMFFDKKIKDGKLTFVLPKGIGDVIQMKLLDMDLIKSVLYGLLQS